MHVETVVPSRAADQLERALQRARLCADIADEFRARDIVILDLTRLTPEFDYFVICTGNARRQMHAIVDEANKRMGQCGNRAIGQEGYNESEWILQDYGDVVLHVFLPEQRELYDLEHLWAEAPRVEWTPKPQGG